MVREAIHQEQQGRPEEPEGDATHGLAQERRALARHLVQGVGRLEPPGGNQVRNRRRDGGVEDGPQDARPERHREQHHDDGPGPAGNHEQQPGQPQHGDAPGQVGGDDDRLAGVTVGEGARERSENDAR